MNNSWVQALIPPVFALLDRPTERTSMRDLNQAMAEWKEFATNNGVEFVVVEKSIVVSNAAHFMIILKNEKYTQHFDVYRDGVVVLRAKGGDLVIYPNLQ